MSPHHFVVRGLAGVDTAIHNYTLLYNVTYTTNYTSPQLRYSVLRRIGDIQRSPGIVILQRSSEGLLLAARESATSGSGPTIIRGCYLFVFPLFFNLDQLDHSRT